jgi:hypothetical protein
MSTQQTLITLLTNQLSAANIVYKSSPASTAIIPYMAPSVFIPLYLQNQKKQVLITVRPTQGVNSRYLQQVSHTQKDDYELGVWCLSKTPDLNSDFQEMRDSAVAELKRVITANPETASLKGIRNDDHLIGGNQQIYNTSIIITNKNYT